MNLIKEHPPILVHDGLAEFLGGPLEAETFSISLIDAGRLSGHLCPTVTGAFLVAQAAVRELFPENVCERGLVRVEIPGSASTGVNGPMSQVMSFITGAWAETGFAGIGGRHVRKNLLRFNCDDLQPGQFRFTRADTGKTVLVTYLPSRAKNSPCSNLSFQEMCRRKVLDVLESPEVVSVQVINPK